MKEFEIKEKDNFKHTIVFDGVKMGAHIIFNGYKIGEIKDQFLRYTFEIP